MSVRFVTRFGSLMVGVAALAAALSPSAASAASVTPAVAAPVLHQSMSPGIVGIPVGGTEKVYAAVSNTGTAAATQVIMNLAMMGGTAATAPRLVGFSSPTALTWNGMFWTWHVGTLMPGQSGVLGIAIRSYGATTRTDMGYATSGNGPTGSVGYSCDNPACTDYLHIVSPMPSAAFIAVTPQGSAVYVNSLVKQYTTAWAASPARTVYVQRLLSTGWQTILSRTTNSIGRISVGFIQPNRFTYRVYVSPTPSAAAVYSGGAAG